MPRLTRLVSPISVVSSEEAEEPLEDLPPTFTVVTPSQQLARASPAMPSRAASNEEAQSTQPNNATGSRQSLPETAATKGGTDETEGNSPSRYTNLGMDAIRTRSGASTAQAATSSRASSTRASSAQLSSAKLSSATSPSARPISLGRSPSSRSEDELLMDLESYDTLDEKDRAQSEDIGADTRRDGSAGLKTNSRSHMDSPSRQRTRLYVDIQLMPIQQLEEYRVAPGSSRPSRSSRKRVLAEQEGQADRKGARHITSSGKAGPSVIDARRDRSVSDSDEGYDQLEDSEEDAVTEGSEASEDTIVLRRSTRVPRQPTKAKGKERIQTRSSHRQVVDSESELDEPPRRKMVPSSQFYGNDKSRRPAQTKRLSPSSEVIEIGSSSSDDDRPAPSKRTTGKRRVVVFDSEEDELASMEQESIGEWVESEEKQPRAKKIRAASPEEDAGAEALYRHRWFCEKCARGPADDLLQQALANKKKRGRRKRRHEDDMSDEELANSLGGWIECGTCCSAAHWACLGTTQQRDVLDELLDKEGPPLHGRPRRKEVGVEESTSSTCAKCRRYRACFECHKTDIAPASNDPANNPPVDGVSAAERDEGRILFRCIRCKRPCHYEHLKKQSEEATLPQTALHYQTPSSGLRDDAWHCHFCRETPWAVDIICAWRPSPADAVEPYFEGIADWKAKLPREYLIKWVDRGFRHATWVPHEWLQVIAGQKLRKFLEKGPSLDLITDETLAARGDDMASPTISNVLGRSDAEQSGHSRSHQPLRDIWADRGPPPDPEAESSIPDLWRTVDRVLDVMLLPQKMIKRDRGRPSNGRTMRSETPEPYERLSVAPNSDWPDGVEPDPADLVDMDDWERRAGRRITSADVDEIAGYAVWCFVKWEDLQYDQSTWDTPPNKDGPFYAAYKRALGRYLSARLVNPPILTRQDIQRRERQAAMVTAPPQKQPECVVGGTLMPFQVEGFGWLAWKYFKRESRILADDMGLGKTIQIASFLGYLGSKELQIYPCLVVVPNSTITNWVREFEKWVPHLRVVPYYGEAASRKVIARYELYHKGQQGKAAGLKAHIVLTTYDVTTGSDFSIFSKMPRWDAVVVDEGQRLKSDSNLIFKRLSSLISVHRILLTGTPLNNNLRELFNLLNFLDPESFRNLEQLEAQFPPEALNETLVQELHQMIQPYILRRIKADVLKLPPKIEIIVPISLTPVQKRVYKTILEKNAEVLRAIGEARRRKAKRAQNAAPLPRPVINGTTTASGTATPAEPSATEHEPIEVD